MTLSPHSQPFQHSGRSCVPRVAPGHDPMLAPCREQVAQQAARCLSSVTMTLVLRSDGEAYLALARVIRERPGCAVAGELSGRAQDHGELEPFTRGIRVLRHNLADKAFTRHPRIGRVPALEAGHPGGGAVSHECL